MLVPIPLADTGYPVLDLHRLTKQVERLVVDAQRVVPDMNKPVIDLDPINRNLESPKPATRVDEVMTVLFRLEPNQVRTEESVQQRLPRIQTTKDLRRGERRVQEEPNLRAG